MAGLAKGLAVLETFGAARKAVTITEAAEATSLSRPSARRCLLTLVELGYLTHDGKYFHPTPRLLRLGSAYTETASLPQLAQPHLAATRDRLGESVSLAVLHENEALFVARAEATGHVLLGGLDEAELDAYLGTIRPQRRTPRTPVSHAEIRRRIQQARETGIAHTDEELELSLRSLAVPVTDARGRIRAAMSVSAAARVPLQQMYDEFAPVLVAHARALGNLL
jgi:IclR family pca regulon transcriptional regulator